MDVLIIGAGAVGLGLGASLHHSGHAVRYWLRDAHCPGDASAKEPGEGAAAAPHPIETSGITRSGLFGDVHVPAEAIEVWRTRADWHRARLDFVLVCTKTTSNASVAKMLGQYWHELEAEPRVVLCQNGWGSAERFAAHLPRERIDSARIITGFRRLGPNHVDITVHADAIHLGHLFGPPSRELEVLAEAITQGGLPCATVPDIERDLWAKLIYNCLLNPLGALTRVRYGALAESAETRSIMQAVAVEIFEVLEATQRRTHWSSAAEYLETFYAELLPATAQHESSMLQDLEAQRPTEIDALCGAVARLGGQVGVETPVNAALATLVAAAEQRARGEVASGP